MELIKNFKRNWAIRSYIKMLPGLLAKDYGKSATYTPKQVKRATEHPILNGSYACYAIALFSSREGFDQYHEEIGETCDYDAMRSKIAQGHFQENVQFDRGEIESVCFECGGHMNTAILKEMV